MKCQRATGFQELDQCSELDLVHRLWEAIHAGDHKFVKVAAHQDVGSIRGLLDRYRALGNQRANDSAIEACRHMNPPEARQLKLMAEDVTRERDFLKRLFQLHLILHQTRSQIEQQNKQQDDHRLESAQPSEQLSLLQQWRVEIPWQMETPLADFTDKSVMGPTLSRCFMEWSRQLQWPMHPCETGDPGVTFMELALSFMLESRCYVPVRRPRADGTMHYYVPESGSSAIAQCITLAELGQMFAYWAHQMMQLRLPAPWPAHRHAGCKSLYRLGAKHQSKGVICRPVMPHQNQTMHMLSVIAKAAGASLPQRSVVIDVREDIMHIREELKDSIARKQERVKRLIPQMRRHAGIL